MPDSATLLTYALNGITLATLLIAMAAAALIGRDARRRGLSRTRALAWVLLSLILLPIGVGLYLLLGRPPQRT